MIEALRRQNMNHTELVTLARLAYIYGFPAYEMARLRFQAFQKPGRRNAARVNSFRHSKQLSTPQTSGVTAVNSDTLFSVGWLDLSHGVQLLHVPDVGERYYSVSLMDFYTNTFALLGRRTTGKTTADFLLVGPQSDDAALESKISARFGEMRVLRAPTNSIRALIRILVDGPDDCATAAALQEKFTIKPALPPVSDSPRRIEVLPIPEAALLRADPLNFFDVLNAILTENPPPTQDAVVISHLRAVEIGPGQRFNRRNFSQSELAALSQGVLSARAILRQPVRRLIDVDPTLASLIGAGEPANEAPPPGKFPARVIGPRKMTWESPPESIGNFGTRYLLRARYALSGFGALPPEEAMYFTAAKDDFGNPLTGRRRYVVIFPPGGLPPVDAFWSLTIYQSDANRRLWLVPNVINRYSIGDRTPHLRYGPDGSLRIFVQTARPVINEENWLPCPGGPFLLSLRAYEPHRDLLEGRYVMPRLQPRQ